MQSKNQLKLVLAVTNDKYEFPVYIEDSYLAMSRKTGVPHPTIYRQCKGISHTKGKIKFVEVKI